MATYHHKYQKKGHYLLHPSLIEYKRDGWGFQIKFNLILLIILGTMRAMPVAWMSFDLTMTILIVGFWFIGRFLMLKGKFPFKTYYKRDYVSDDFLFFCKMIIHGAVVRTVIVSLFYLFSLYLAMGDRYETSSTLLKIEQIVFNPIPQLIAVATFLFLFYYMFLKEKYVTIEDFSREVMNIVSYRGRGINEAVLEFIYLRDSILEKELISGVKCNHREEYLQKTVKDNRQETNQNESFTNSYSSVGNTETTVSASSPEPMRRQSRR